MDDEVNIRDNCGELMLEYIYSLRHTTSNDSLEAIEHSIKSDIKEMYHIVYGRAKAAGTITNQDDMVEIEQLSLCLKGEVIACRERIANGTAFQYSINQSFLGL